MTAERASHPVTAVPSARVVLAMIHGAAERRQLAAALQGVAPLVLCDTIGDVVARIDRGDVGTLVAELRDGSGSNTAGVLAGLNARLPEVRILLYVALSADDIHALAEFVSATPVIRGLDDIGRAAFRAARTTVVWSAQAAIAAATMPQVPLRLRAFFRACALDADRPLSVRRAVHRARMPYRTLFTHVHHAGFPPPRVIIAWHRLLHAAWAGEGVARTRDVVAHQLAFSSGSALSHLLRHHTGLTWRTLRAHGGFPFLLQQFVETLAAGTAAAQPEGRPPALGA